MASPSSEKNIAEVFHDLGKAWALHDVVRDKNGKIVNYKIVDANLLFEEVLGIPVKQAKEKLATDLYNVDVPPFLDEYAHVVETGEVTAFDQYYKPLDMHFHIQVYKPHKDGFVTIFEDITRQKKLERGHKHQDAVFKLMQHLNKLLWEIDDDTKLASIIAKGVQDYPEAYDSAWILLFDDNKHVSQFASFNLRNADAFEEKIRNGNFPKQFKEALNKPEGMYTRLPEEPCEDCILSGEHAENAVFVKALYYSNTIYGILAVSLDKHFIRIDNEKERFIEFIDDISFFLDAIYNKQQLEKVKNDLDTTLYSIGDAVISTDADGHVARMNPVAQNLCGMDIAEARGKPLTEVFRIVNALTHKPVDNPVDKVFETGEIVGLANHTLLLSHDDAEYQIADSAAPIRNTDNELLGIVLVFRDVTEAYQQHEELIRSEALYRTVFKNTGTATCTYGDDGIIIRCNEKFEELAALPAEKIEGKQRWSDFVSKTDLKRMAEYHKRRTQGEYVRVDHEFIFIDAEGVEKDVLVRVGMESDSRIRVASLLDITERNRLSKELKESEEKFRKMAEHSATAIMMHQNDYWIYANPAAETLSGYSIPELLTMKFWEFTHPDSAKAVKEAGRARASNEGANTRYELKIVTKQGETKWMDLSGSTIMYNGKPAGLVTVYDITARKKAEAEVESKLHELERLAENLPSVIWKSEVTPEGDFVNTYIADGVDDLLKLPRGSIKNDWNKFFSFVTPEYLTDVWNAFDEVLKHPGKKIAREYMVTKTNGTNAWFRSVGRCYMEGDKTYLFGSTEDISERIRTRKRLIARSAAINSAIDGIALLNKKGEYIFMNPAHAETYGYSDPSELIGKTWQYLYSGKELKRFKNKIMPEFSKKGRWRGEAIGTKKDGSEFPQEVSLTALDDEELICIVRDITERKQTEHALRKAKNKAEESDRLKSAFLANVSHEIRTPMNGILGFANLLEENDLSKEEHHNYLQVIQRSGKRMLNIINDLIDISRIEAGQTELKPVKVHLKDIFDEQFDFFNNEAKQNGIKLQFNTDKLWRKAVLCDKTKLSQILTNLIKNALKYTDKGEIRVDAECKENRLYCSVSDTGVGIPKDKLMNIFNRFSQVEHDDGRVFEGAGLGLSITKAFVEMMDGEVSVTSEEGEGSCFSFNISVEEPEDKKDKTDMYVEDIYDISDKTILVVEDDSDSVSLVKALLNRLNPGKVLIATDGREALRLVDSYSNINMVLLDIRLPKMDGFTVCKKIKQMRPGIPVVAQTAFAADVDKTEALRRGFDGSILKSV